MAQPHFSLSWKEHNLNICNGFSALQQNEEFVDMTIAADGHSVKVHQVIMALASPYIKHLISSANCPHPVIFLNKISYATLTSILEYIYTGEVFVSIENINEFIEAGKELHIQGLTKLNSDMVKSSVSANIENNYHNLQMHSTSNDTKEDNMNDDRMDIIRDGIYYMQQDDSEVGNEPISKTSSLPSDTDERDETIKSEPKTLLKTLKSETNCAPEQEKSILNRPGILQYTVSNRGSIQMILNRYMYNLKYTKRHNVRQWRCVDYLNSIKCRAQVVTEDDVVIQRVAAHTHSFHDKRILKKVRDGAIFTGIAEAVTNGSIKQPEESTTP